MDLKIFGSLKAELPRRVQDIVDGVGSTTYCSNCRAPDAPFRCARCRGETPLKRYHRVCSFSSILTRSHRFLVAKYCSSECQKSHFAFHKKDCKCIDKRRKEVEEEVKGIEETKKNGDSQFEFEAGMDTFLDQDTDATVVCVRLADTILKTGYRESDTVEHGNNYYREALKCYLLPMKIMAPENGSFVPNHCFRKFRFIEERVLFLLILLGGDRRVLYDWTSGSSGLYTHTCKNGYFGRGYLHYWNEEQRRLLPHLTTEMTSFRGELEELPRVLYGYSFSDSDLNFSGIMLLAGMRSLAIRREGEARLAACTNAHPGTLIGQVFLSQDIMEHITSFVLQKEHWWFDSELEEDFSHGDDCTQYITGLVEFRECPPELCRHAQAQARLRKQIEMALRAIRHAGSGDLINGIREEIPLRPDTGRAENGRGMFRRIATLFQPNNFHEVLQFLKAIPNPNELWMLYQDCFFETPGVMDVFNEFVH